MCESGPLGHVVGCQDSERVDSIAEEPGDDGDDEEEDDEVGCELDGDDMRRSRTVRLGVSQR